MVFLIDDWTKEDGVLKLLRPGWVVHSQVELNQFSLGRSILIFFLASYEGNQANIFLRNFDTIWLWLIKLDLENQIWITFFTTFFIILISLVIELFSEFFSFVGSS